VYLDKIGHVDVDGPTFAKIVTKIDDFRRARGGDDGPITLIACSVGVPGGFAETFQQTMKALGAGGPVNAPTHQVNMHVWRSKRARGASIDDGGYWNVFGELSPERWAATVRELVEALRRNWQYAPSAELASGSRIPITDRAGTLKLVQEIVNSHRRVLRQNRGDLDLVGVEQSATVWHEQPTLVVDVVLSFFASYPGAVPVVRWVTDRYRDGESNKWLPVDLSAHARARFTVTGQASWDYETGLVSRPVKLVALGSAEPLWVAAAAEPEPVDVYLTQGLRGTAQIEWWGRRLAEIAVERTTDGLSLPFVRIVDYGNSARGPAVRAGFALRVGEALEELTPPGEPIIDAESIVPRLEGVGGGGLDLSDPSIPRPIYRVHLGGPADELPHSHGLVSSSGRIGLSKSGLWNSSRSAPGASGSATSLVSQLAGLRAGDVEFLTGRDGHPAPHYESVTGNDGQITGLTSPSGKHAYALHDVPQDGNSFYHAFAGALQHMDPALLRARIDTATPHTIASGLHELLSNQLRAPNNADLVHFAAPDKRDTFTPEEIAPNGIRFGEPGVETPQRREFDALGVIPNSTPLTPEQRLGLATTQLRRPGNASQANVADGGVRRYIDWDHGAADLLPALAARTFDARVIVVRDDGTFKEFAPPGVEPAHQVVLHLSDRHFRFAAPTDANEPHVIGEPATHPPGTGITAVSTQQSKTLKDLASDIKSPQDIKGKGWETPPEPLTTSRAAHSNTVTSFTRTGSDTLVSSDGTVLDLQEVPDG
jgi:hypothetical protein